MILSLLIPLAMIVLAHKWSREHREQIERPPTQAPSNVRRLPR